MIREFRKFFKNKKGLSLISVLAAAAIGLIVVLGLTRALIHMSEETGTIQKKAAAVEIQKNVFNVLRSSKAWYCTVEESGAAGTGGKDGSRCYPGSMDAAGTSRCPMHFWFNEKNEDTVEDYCHEPTDTPASQLKQWAVDDNTHNYATGLFQTDGRPVYPSDIDATYGSACAGADADSLETCITTANPSLIGKYFKVTVTTPTIAATTSNSLPNFKVEIADVAGTKHIHSFYILEQANSIDDSGGTPTGFVQVDVYGGTGFFYISETYNGNAAKLIVSAAGPCHCHFQIEAGTFNTRVGADDTVGGIQWEDDTIQQVQDGVCCCRVYFGKVKLSGDSCANFNDEGDI